MNSAHTVNACFALTLRNDDSNYCSEILLFVFFTKPGAGQYFFRMHSMEFRLHGDEFPE